MWVCTANLHRRIVAILSFSLGLAFALEETVNASDALILCTSEKRSPTSLFSCSVDCCHLLRRMKYIPYFTKDGLSRIPYHNQLRTSGYIRTYIQFVLQLDSNRSEGTVSRGCLVGRQKASIYVCTYLHKLLCLRIFQAIVGIWGSEWGTG